jgi:hypothetical protein
LPGAGLSQTTINPPFQQKECSNVHFLIRDMEEAAVKQRSRWVGICAGVLGLTLALAPLTAASAKTTKGSAPNSAMCKTVKSEQSGSSAASGAIEKAMTSGNFAAAKAAMLKAYSGDFNQVQKALAVIKGAPANVQAAFKDLLAFVKQFKAAIQNSTSVTSLLASFETLGKNPKLATDGATISNWYTSVCGGTSVTPSTVASP